MERSKSSYDLDKILNTFGITPTVSRSGSGDTEMTVSRSDSIQEDEQSNASSIMSFSLFFPDPYLGFITSTSEETVSIAPNDA